MWPDLSTEQMREQHGWFGAPWPSGVCYDDDDIRVRWEAHKPTPVDEPCAWCEEPFVVGDQGAAMPHLGEAGMVVRHLHKECLLRQVLGSFAHVTGDCPGDGSCNHLDDGMTPRQDALAVWEWTRSHARDN